MAGSAWTVRPSDFKRKVINDHKGLAASVALRLDRALVTETPHETGYAASNWMPGVGAPDLRVIDGGTDDSALTRAQAVFDAGAVPDFPNLYISNAVVYIGVLNYGRPAGTQHSLKAPLHFVELAIEGLRA